MGYSNQTPAPGGWKPVPSHAGVDGLFTWMHRMHRIFSETGGPAVLENRKSASNHRPSRLLVQEALVLIILCILCIHVQNPAIKMRSLTLECSAPSPGAGAWLTNCYAHRFMLAAYAAQTLCPICQWLAPGLHSDRTRLPRINAVGVHSCPFVVRLFVVTLFETGYSARAVEAAPLRRRLRRPE